MKVLLNIFVSILLTVFTSKANEAYVNIPDANFKAALIGLNAVDINSDGEISYAEAAAVVTGLNLNDSEISDLTGIEAFVNITWINCGGNKITSFNISNNTKLVSLYCANNQLTSLDVSNNTGLTFLNSEENNITSLNLSSNSELESLTLGHNQITSLNLSNNTKLQELWCDNNQFTVLNLSDNKSLTHLYCGFNLLTTLDLSENSELLVLECNDNQLTSLIFSGANLLSLICSSNQLASLNVSDCTMLQILDCKINNLPSLDLSECSALIEIDISSNPDLVNVCVWEMPFPTGDIISLSADPGVVYSTTCITGIKEFFDRKGEISIFPNPADNIFLVNLPGADIYHLQLTDFNGKVVYSNSSYCNNEEVQISSFRKGVYLLKVLNGSRILESKLIIK